MRTIKTKQDAINHAEKLIKKLTYTGLLFTPRVEKSKHSGKWLVFISPAVWE